jgi:hypothetical protein
LSLPAAAFFLVFAIFLILRSWFIRVRLQMTD